MAIPKLKVLNKFDQVCSLDELITHRRFVKLLVPAWTEQHWATVRIFDPPNDDTRNSYVVIMFCQALRENDRERARWLDLCVDLFHGKYGFKVAMTLPVED